MEVIEREQRKLDAALEKERFDTRERSGRAYRFDWTFYNVSYQVLYEEVLNLYGPSATREARDAYMAFIDAKQWALFLTAPDDWFSSPEAERDVTARGAVGAVRLPALWAEYADALDDLADRCP